MDDPSEYFRGVADKTRRQSYADWPPEVRDACAAWLKVREERRAEHKPEPSVRSLVHYLKSKLDFPATLYTVRKFLELEFGAGS